MDYRIDLAIPEGRSISGFLSALAQVPGATVIGAHEVKLGSGTTTVSPPSAVTWTGEAPSELYKVLQTYFAWSEDEDASVLLTDRAGSELNMIVISREAEIEVGRHETGIAMREMDVLATEAVFLSVWPMLINETDDEFEEFAPDMTGQHVAVDADRSVIIAPLLGTSEDDHETTSFIAFGVTASEVMQQLLTVPEYVAEDPSYLTYEIDRIEATVLAVGFDTDRGAAIEIRLPLQRKRVMDAQALLARQNAATLNAELYYVTGIDDEQELFTIQKMAPDGALLAPEELKLVFE